MVLFLGVFLDIFVQFAAEAGAAVVTSRFGASAIGEATRKGCAAVVAFVGGGTGAGAGRREENVADLAAIVWAFASGCEWWKRVVAVEAMLGRGWIIGLVD